MTTGRWALRTRCLVAPLACCLLLLTSCESVKTFMARDLEEEDFIIGQLYVDEMVNETPVIASPVEAKPQRKKADGSDCNNALGLKCNDDDNEEELYVSVEDGDIVDAVYSLFKERFKDSFEFED